MDSKRSDSVESLPEPLSERELEVLACLADGLSNQEIANKLYLAVQTVRWYNSQIYSKLGVSNRHDALERTQALGLLPKASDIPDVNGKHNLPKQATPFIGREHELVELTTLLNNENTHLITILAPGGMGKTRLALEVAGLQISHYADGVVFVPLAPLSSPSDIVTTIAENVGFIFHGEDALAQQLINFLCDRSTLLILDNFEHLLDGSQLIADLIQIAPNVRLITTSRERLNLRGETVYTLQGLDFPTWETPEDALQYDAVKLFMQSACRVRTNFTLHTHDLDYLARICRLTAGLPLGIELAAGWIDVLSLEQIASEIQKGIAILETEMRDIPKRHRSIRATFDYSWQRLTQDEQAVFMRLSVFRGGFTIQAAEAVAGASIRSLKQLANKSLIQVSPDHRHDIHELLRQFAQEKLNDSENEAATIRDLHSAYYADFIDYWWARLKTNELLIALQEIENEFDNVLTAWRNTSEMGKALEIHKIAVGLFHFMDIRGRFQEALDLLSNTIKRLRVAPNDQNTQIALGYTLARQAWFCVHMGNPTRGKQVAEESLAILQHYDSPEAMMEAVLSLIRANSYLGHWDEAKSLAQEGLSIARVRGDRWWVLNFLYWVGHSCRALHQYAEAVMYGTEGLELAQQLDTPYWLAGISGMLLGTTAYEMGNYLEAKRRFEYALELLEIIGHRWFLAINYSQLGGVALALNDFNLAKHCFRKRLTIFADSGMQTWETVRTLFNIATVLMAEEQSERAVEILSFYVQHPTTLKIHREEAKDLIIELHKKLDPNVYNVAWSRGEKRELNALVNELLAEFKDN